MEAGYVLPSGKLLDFSGKKFGGRPHTRSLDHSEVPKQLFRKHGAVRINVGRGISEVDIDVGTDTMPSRKQWKTIKHILSTGKGVHGKTPTLFMDIKGKPNVYEGNLLLASREFPKPLKQMPIIRWTIKGYKARRKKR